MKQSIGSRGWRVRGLRQRGRRFFPASYQVMERLADGLQRFDVGKGTIRFPIGRPRLSRG
jgi:hypothetical protein